MDITDYVNLKGSSLSFDAEQASRFAKHVAGDFNPLHDPSNKRFCIPGDLLFSVVLHHYGVHQSMTVEFSGMLDASAEVQLPDGAAGSASMKDARQRECLSASWSGESTQDDSFIAALTTEYVRFSGQTFPDILVPLMRKHDVMINPSRPLVIYQSMQLSMTALAGENLAVSLSDAELTVAGKKGTALLSFSLIADGLPIGTGSKTMLLGGLRAFDADAMQSVVDEYNVLKTAG